MLAGRESFCKEEYNESMKWLAGVIVVLLVVAGVFLGISIGKDESSNTPAGTASTSGTHVVDLSGQGLTEVTAAVYEKTDTTDLILSDNSIKSLPSQMGKMTKVVVFKIDNNVLEGSLIGEIRQMTKLEVLDVSDNNMTGMPAEIGDLSKLRTLDYSQNKITNLPNELTKLSGNLKELNLTGNPINQATIDNLKQSLPNTTIIF